MNHKDYQTSIIVNVTAKEAQGAINKVSEWWTKEAAGVKTEFEGQSTKLNDEFVLRHGENHYSKQKLIEVIPDKKVVWFVTDSKLNWIEKDRYEWTGTKMIFELNYQGGKTVLKFTHQGLVPEKECYEHSVQFWDMVIKEWLFNFISEDKVHY